MASKKEELKAAFKSWDCSGDGRIDADTLISIVQMLSPDIAPDQLARLLKKKELCDGQNRLGCDEFVDFIYSVSGEDQAEDTEELEKMKEALRYRKRAHTIFHMQAEAASQAEEVEMDKIASAQRNRRGENTCMVDVAAAATQAEEDEQLKIQEAAAFRRRAHTVLHSKAAIASEMMPKLRIFDLPVGGRAELARLIAAAGGLQLESCPTEEYGNAALGEVGALGALPLLMHGMIKINESQAIEGCIARLAPEYRDLTEQQQAVDEEFAAMKRGVLSGVLEVLMADDEAAAVANARATLSAHFRRTLEPLERRLPDSGFVHGLQLPTCADLAVLNVVQGDDFIWGFRVAGIFDTFAERYPRAVRLAKLVAAHPPVQDYLELSRCATAT